MQASKTKLPKSNNRHIEYWVGVGLAIFVGWLVVMDYRVSYLIDRDVWRTVFLDNVPGRVSLVLIIGLVLGATGLALFRQAGTARDRFIVVLLIAAQLTGLRVGPLDTFDGVFLTCLGIWLALHLMGHSDFTQMRLSGVVLASLFFIVLQVPHLVQQNPARWLVGIIGIFKVVTIPLLLINLLNSRKLIMRWIYLFRWIAFVSAVVAIIQFSAAYYGIYYFTLIGEVEDAFKPTPIGFVMRGSAFNFTAQHLSGFLVLALPTWLMYWSDTGRIFNWRAFSPMLVVMAGILVSWNYSAFVGAGVVLALFPFFRWPRASLHIALIYISIALVAYYSGFLELIWDVTLGNHGVAKGADQRLTLFKFGLESLWRNPWFGVGARDMAEFSGNYWGRPVHNAYFQAYTELGIFALLLFCGIFLYLMFAVLALAPKHHKKESHNIVGVGLSIIGYMFICLNEPNFDNLNTWLLVGLGAAIINIYNAAPKNGAERW